MARVWQPLQNPDFPATRSRSIIRAKAGSASTTWGQRPMFSEPGDKQPQPDMGVLGPEVQIDDEHPSDGGVNSDE